MVSGSFFAFFSKTVPKNIASPVPKNQTLIFFNLVASIDRNLTQDNHQLRMVLRGIPNAIHVVSPASFPNKTAACPAKPMTTNAENGLKATFEEDENFSSTIPRNFVNKCAWKVCKIIRESKSNIIKWGYFSLRGFPGQLPASGEMLLVHFPRSTPELQLPLVSFLL